MKKLLKTFSFRFSDVSINKELHTDVHVPLLRVHTGCGDKKKEEKSQPGGFSSF